MGIRVTDWKTKPISLRRIRSRWFSLRDEISLPSRKTWPSLGLSSAPIILSRVVFPEPELPYRMVREDMGTSILIPFRA